jgi:hypothetical protein
MPPCKHTSLPLDKKAVQHNSRTVNATAANAHARFDAKPTFVCRLVLEAPYCHQHAIWPVALWCVDVSAKVGFANQHTVILAGEQLHVLHTPAAAAAAAAAPHNRLLSVLRHIAPATGLSCRPACTRSAKN